MRKWYMIALLSYPSLASSGTGRLDGDIGAHKAESDTANNLGKLVMQYLCSAVPGAWQRRLRI